MIALGTPGFSVLDGVLDGVLLAALVWAVVTDLRSRRISNRLTYPLMALGLAANAATGGWGGLLESALGWLAGIAILAVPFALGGIGGGDLKLLAAIGALQGPQFVLLTAVYAGLAGGLLAVFALARAQGVGSLLRPLGRGRRGGAPDSDAGTAAARRAATIAYGPAIAAGAVIVLFRTRFGY